MSEANGHANGADKTNGGEAPAAVAAIAVRERPPAPAPAQRPSFERSHAERTHGVGPSDLESLGSLGARNGAKMQATTRVVNSFMGYLVNVCGRAPDQLTEADVAAIGSMLSTLDGLEKPGRRGGIS